MGNGMGRYRVIGFRVVKIDLPEFADPGRVNFMVRVTGSEFWVSGSELSIINLKQKL